MQAEILDPPIIQAAMMNTRTVAKSSTLQAAKDSPLNLSCSTQNRAAIMFDSLIQLKPSLKHLT